MEVHQHGQVQQEVPQGWRPLGRGTVMTEELLDSPSRLYLSSKSTSILFHGVVAWELNDGTE